MSGAYYNEIEPFAAAWLRNLIAAGHVAPGDVDERDIRDVRPDDLRGYTQCHFFAGIGGWSLALRLAGWPDDRPVWTGSCPCQPFSVAGNQEGFNDPRHLWPEFRRLIAECRPATVFGEQVAGAADWLGLVRGNLGEVGYAVGAMPIEAASAHADHFRDRYWFVANRDEQRAGEGWLQRGGKLSRSGGASENRPGPVANGDGGGGVAREQAPATLRHRSSAVAEGGADRDWAVVDDPSVGWGEGWTEHEFRSRGFTAAVASIDGVQYVECSDGKWRRLPPPRVRWLGNGIPARVAKLRAIGNAIDPRPAQAFIESYLEAELFL